MILDPVSTPSAFIPKYSLVPFRGLVHLWIRASAPILVERVMDNVEATIVPLG